MMTRFLRLGLFLPLAMCFALLLTLAPNADAAGSAVSIQGFAFHPSAISVPVGSTITWTNQDSAPHTATAKDGSFDTGTLKQGQSMTVTFSKEGTYAYYCQFHPFMLGTVTVTAAAAPAAPAAPAAATTTQAAQTTARIVTTAATRNNPPANAAPATATTPAPTPNRLPSTGAGGSASTRGGAILAGLLALVLGASLVARRQRRQSSLLLALAPHPATCRIERLRACQCTGELETEVPTP